MPPELLSIGVFALQEIIKHEPEIAAAIKELFTKADPTAEDWAALKAKIHSKSYRDYVPATALPAAAPAPALSAAVEQPVAIRVLPAPGPVTPASTSAGTDAAAGGNAGKVTPEILAAQKAAIEAYAALLASKEKAGAPAAMSPSGGETSPRLVSMTDAQPVERVVAVPTPSAEQPQQAS